MKGLQSGGRAPPVRRWPSGVDQAANDRSPAALLEVYPSRYW